MADRWELKINPPCLPVSILEAKRHLRLDKFYTEEDISIEALIRSASFDVENKTSRTMVSSVWSWEIENIEIGVEKDFPIVPVTNVVIYNNDLPSVNPDLAEGETEEEPFNLVPKELYNVIYPSLSPQGSPLVGSISFAEGFPTNVSIELTAGYPVQEEENPITPEGNPVLSPESTGYAQGSVNPDTLEVIEFDKIALVFSRKVHGSVETQNFRVYDKINGFELVINSVEANSDLGVVFLYLEPNTLVADQELQVNYAGGFLEDDFEHFVDIIENAGIPKVELPKEFVAPPENPVEITYTSNAPQPLKQWIVVRVGTLYQQRSEIALRAGKSNDSLFSRGFIDSLLDPYILRRMF